MTIEDSCIPLFDSRTRQMAHALVSKREYLQPFLHLMLRDDIVAWHISKTNKVRKDERKGGGL